MDKDDIIKNSDYIKTRKVSWWSKNGDKVELVVLILILIALGTDVGLTYLNYSKSSNDDSTIVDENTVSSTDEEVYREISLVTESGRVCYEDIVKVGSVFNLVDVPTGKYYLSDSEDVLFTASKDDSSVSCQVLSDFEMSCTVTEPEETTTNTTTTTSDTTSSETETSTSTSEQSSTDETQTEGE